MEIFEILPGLPPYGPPALPIPEDGYRSYSEGLVVQFKPKNSGSWIGNFQRGMNNFDCVLPHPNRVDVVVIAGGNGYIVDPETPKITDEMPHGVTRAIPLPGLKSIIFGNDTKFWSISAHGESWATPHISWDGMRNITVIDYNLTGEAWSAADDMWHPFALDMRSGTVENAIYPQDIKRAVPVRRSAQFRWAKLVHWVRRTLAARRPRV